MTSRPDTTSSDEAGLPRPPGPGEDAARPEPDARTAGDVPADAQEAGEAGEAGEAAADADSGGSANGAGRARDGAPGGGPVEGTAQQLVEEPPKELVAEPAEPVAEPPVPAADPTAPVADPAEPVGELTEPVAEPAHEAAEAPSGEPAPEQTAEEPVVESADRDEEQAEAGEEAPDVAASLLPREAQGAAPAPRTVARGRLSHAMRPRATRAQMLAGLLCALLGFALVVQARQTQTQGLDQLRQADLVRLLDNVTNAEARAEQDVRNQQAIRDRLLSGSDSSEAAQQAAQQRLDTLGLLAGTVQATGPGIELDITDPRRQIDASVLLDTLEELRDGGAEVIQIGNVRVVAATAFTDDADGVRVDGRLLTPPYRYRVIGDPQTLAKVLQIPGGVLDVLRSKGAQGRVTQASTVRVDALRAPTAPQYARSAPGGTP